MKKHTVGFLILVLILLALLAGMSACTKRTELPGAAPVGTEAYWADISEMMSSNIALSDGKNGWTLSGKLNSLEETSLLAIFNYDADAPAESLFAMKLYGEDGNKLFVKADNEKTYLNIAPNEYVGDANMKLLNTSIFDVLNVGYNRNNIAAAQEKFYGLLVSVGNFLFKNVEINATNTEFSFTFNTDYTSKESIRKLTALTDMISGSFLKTVFYVLDITTVEELAARLPVLQGSLCFVTENGRVRSVRTDSVSIADSAELSLDIEARAGMSSAEYIESEFPVSDSGYIVTAVGNLFADGTVALLTSNGNKQAAKYDFELNMNIDYIKLIASDYDISQLPSGNYFHLRISHKCDGYCTEFCRSKLSHDKGGSQGAVLDIAFSPDDFDSGNIFIVTNIKHLIGEEYLSRINKYPLDITGMTLTDYCLFAFPPTAFSDGSVFKDLLVMLCSDLLFAPGTYTLPTAKIISMLTGGGLAEELFSNFLVSDEYDNDIMKIKIKTSRFGQSNHYDVYNQAVNVVDAGSADTKNFYHPALGVLMGLEYGALDWSIEEAALTVDGLRLSNIYSASGELIHGVSDGKYVPMSVQEARGLVGKHLKGSYTGFDKQTVNATEFEILSVESINYASRDVQEVILRVKYPSPSDYLYFNKLFESYENDFDILVKVFIKLTEEESYTFEQDVLENSVFSLTYHSTVAPAFLKGVINIYYTGGLKKSIAVEGVSDAVTVSWSSLPGVGTKRYSVHDWGEITVLFSAANRQIEKKYTVKVPDRFEYEIDESKMKSPVVDESFFTSAITAHAKLYAYYDGVRVQVLLAPSDFYINGIPFTQNASYWVSHPSILTGIDRLVFFAANEYSVVVMKNGVESDPFTLLVSTKQA